jgi:hypothetical protein
MALSTYADLKGAIANWLARDDLSPYLDDFVTLFEAAANRRLRVRQMETSANLTPSNGAISLPADYLAWRRLTWTGSTRRELEYVHPSYLQAAYPTTPTNLPNVFTIEGPTLKIRPVDGTALELDYWQKIPPLSSGVNWLYGAHPDLYLFGSLVEAEAFNRNVDSGGVWKARRDELFDEIEALSRSTIASAAIRVRGPVV